jgi:hypothetical protein
MNRRPGSSSGARVSDAVVVALVRVVCGAGHGDVVAPGVVTSTSATPPTPTPSPQREEPYPTPLGVLPAVTANTFDRRKVAIVEFPAVREFSSTVYDTAAPDEYARLLLSCRSALCWPRTGTAAWKDRILGSVRRDSARRRSQIDTRFSRRLIASLTSQTSAAHGSRAAR